jgi:hypothetical protein
MRLPSRLVPMLATVAALAALPATAPGTVGPPQPPQPVPEPAIETGLSGYVTRGPVQPVCVLSKPCYRPARVVLRFWRGARLMLQARTRITGVYRVSLEPGVYAVSLLGGGRLKPALVRVPPGGYGHVDFVVDTGIR